MNKNQFRQGDLMIEYVANIPPGAVKVAPVDGRYVLADGEATGHAHTIAADYGDLYERNGVLYFVPNSGAPLEHQEHGTQTITKVARIRRQIVEDAAHAPRQVID